MKNSIVMAFSKKPVTGYEWVRNMPNLIFHNAVRNQVPHVTRKVEKLELAEAEREQERILTFEELECSGNLIMREWLERDNCSDHD